MEIVTAGYTRPSTTKKGEVRAWTYSGSAFSLVDDDTWQFDRDQNTIFYGVYDANVDNNATNHDEIVACGSGYSSTASEDQGVLRIYRLVSGTITAYKDTSWDSGSETVCRSVHAADLDTSDAYLEIAAGGWALISNVYNGEIRVFQWTGGSSSITEKTSATQWYTTGNTKVNSIYNGQADNDIPTETASGGQAYDGTHDGGELRVWHL